MKKLILFCTHRPSADPRIDWVATTASKYFDVTVVGRKIEPDETDEPRGPYKIELIEYFKVFQSMSKLWKLKKSIVIVVCLEALWHPLLVFSRMVRYWNIFLRPAIRVKGIQTKVKINNLIRAFIKRIKVFIKRMFRNNKTARAVWERFREKRAAGNVKDIDHAIAVTGLTDSRRYSEDSLCLEKKMAAEEVAPTDGRMNSNVEIHELPDKEFVFSTYKRNHTLGQKINDFSWEWLHYLSVYLGTMEYILRNDVQVDVILCADLDALRAGVWLKKHKSSKLIYDAHEFQAYAYADRLNSHNKWLLKMEKRLIQSVDAAYSVNPFLADYMTKKLKCVPLMAVPNCAPLQEFSVFHDEIDELAHGRKKFLYQGNFSQTRGLEEMLHGWELIDVEKAVLFLRGPENTFMDTLVSIAKKLGILNKSVYFIPAVKEDELIAAARNADVGIIPYKGTLINNKYACPNKLSQYMQAGVAILANDIVFVRDRIETYQNGMIYQCEDRRTFAAAVNTLIENGDLLREYKKNSIRMAKLDYNWDLQCIPMENVLKQYS
jgi:glycosyltransferase involved in cell wall biosynthesis